MMQLLRRISPAYFLALISLFPSLLAAQNITLSVMRTGAGTGSITSSPDGVSCAVGTGNPCTGSFLTGTQITLTATAALDSNFAGWNECDKVSGTTCTVVLKSPRTVYVTFSSGTPVRRQLQVSITGSGGTVTSNPAGIGCPPTCSSSFEAVQQIVVLTAIPAADSAFMSWSGCDKPAGATCTETLSNVTKTVTVAFARLPAPVALNITRNGSGTGTVTSTPAGINCSPASTSCTGSFPPGTQVTLTAAASADSAFGSWAGCDSTSKQLCIVTLPTNVTKAPAVTFTKAPVQLTVTRPQGGPGTVTSTPAGISCGTTATSSCSGTFPAGTQVTLIAKPAGSARFNGWIGCDQSSGTSCTVALTKARTVTANFSGVIRPL